MARAARYYPGARCNRQAAPVKRSLWQRIFPVVELRLGNRTLHLPPWGYLPVGLALLAYVVLISLRWQAMETSLHDDQENQLLRSRLERISTRIDSLSEKVQDMQDVDQDIIDKRNLNLHLPDDNPDPVWMAGGHDFNNPSYRRGMKDLYRRMYRLDWLITRTGDLHQRLVAMVGATQGMYSGVPNFLPVLGRVSDRFGYRVDPFSHMPGFHSGVDFAATYGSPVRASAAGQVDYCGWKAGYGLMVQLDHDFGFMTRYGHCSQLLVQPGDQVEKGQAIARVGSTGRSTGNHLHFEVWKDNRVRNPLSYLGHTMPADMDNLPLGGP